jgi:hypothetical protein
MATDWPLDILERMVKAVEKVRERLVRTTQALNTAAIAHAVVGGNAAGAWVAKQDEGAVRNTRDVNILIRRADFEAVKAAMVVDGFIFASAYGVDFFLDAPNAKPSESVHLLYAGEKVKEADLFPNPLVTESERGAAFQVLSLEPLVRMKLVANRDKDRTHIRDLIGVGLIDDAWPARFPPLLAERLQSMLDTPGG